MQPNVPVQVSFDDEDLPPVVPPSDPVTGVKVEEAALPALHPHAIRYIGADYRVRFEKRTSDRTDYLYDLQQWLEPNETIIGASAVSDPGDIVISSLQFSDTRLYLWLQDGDADVRHNIEITFSTSAGKVGVANFVVMTRTGMTAAPVVEKVGTDKPGMWMPYKARRQFYPYAIFDKREPEQLDYWLDMSRVVEPGEAIASVLAWSDNPLLLITALNFDGDQLVIWLTGGGFEVRNKVIVQIDTTRGRRATVPFLLVSRGQPEEPVYVAGRPADPLDMFIRKDRYIRWDGSPVLTRYRKESRETLDYVLDLSRFLDTGEVITGVGGWASPEGLRVGRLAYTDTEVVTWLSRGADAVRFTVQLRITTSSGKVTIFRFSVITDGQPGKLVEIIVLDTTANVAQVPKITPEPPEPVPAPVLTATPNTLSFPDTAPGSTSASQRLVISNTGDWVMPVRAISVDGKFARLTDPLVQLQPGQSFPVDVTFKPTAYGDASGALLVDIGAGAVTAAVLAGVSVNPDVPVTFSRLSTNGNQFVTPQGAPVRLRSINWFGAESENYTPHGTWKRSWKGIIDQIKSLGFNCIRLPLAGDTLAATPPASVIDATANPDLVGLSALVIIDKIVDYCLQQEIYIILDHHRRKAGAGADGSPVDSSYTLDDWKNFWTTLAGRYRDRLNVVGADLHNEPHDLSWSTWAGYAEQCGNAIHAVAPEWLIVVEGVGGGYWWGGELGGVATRPVQLQQANRLVYSPHEYGQSVGVQSWLAYDNQTPPDNWPANLFGVWKPHWGFIFEQNIAPVWVGEFGGKYGVDGDGHTGSVPNGSFEKQWTQNLITYLNGDFTGDGSSDLPAGKLGMSFSYWSLNPNSTDTGGLLQDDWLTVQATKINLLNPLLAN